MESASCLSIPNPWLKFARIQGWKSDRMHRIDWMIWLILARVSRAFHCSKCRASFQIALKFAIFPIRMFRSRSNTNASRRILLGILCIALIIVGGTIHVAHFHAPGAAPDPGCALCAAAHVAISPAAPIVIPVRAQLVAALIAELQPTAPRRFVVFSLYIRPPPLQVVFA